MCDVLATSLTMLTGAGIFIVGFAVGALVDHRQHMAAK